MYAFVSNEYQTIVYTLGQLEFLRDIYTYPTYCKVNTIAEAKQFIAKCNRKIFNAPINQYGRESDASYITVQYFIDGKNIYVNINTSKFGFIKFSTLPSNVKQDASYDLIKLKICNVALNDDLITHHCIAISNIMNIVDSFMNVELIIPDISVYLALTKYNGKNYAIKNTQKLISCRMGNTFYTIK